MALGLLLIGPWAMDVVFGHGYHYGRVGLAVIAVGMGFHLSRGHASTRPRWPAATPAPRRRCGWLCAAIFVVWMIVPAIDDELLRAEIGYPGAAALLCALLRALYRR